MFWRKKRKATEQKKNRLTKIGKKVRKINKKQSQIRSLIDRYIEEQEEQQHVEKGKESD